MSACAKTNLNFNQSIKLLKMPLPLISELVIMSPIYLSREFYKVVRVVEFKPQWSGLVHTVLHPHGELQTSRTYFSVTTMFFNNPSPTREDYMEVFKNIQKCNIQIQEKRNDWFSEWIEIQKKKREHQPKPQKEVEPKPKLQLSLF